MSIDSLELDLEDQFDKTFRSTGSPQLHGTAIVDSLDQDLEQQFERGFRSASEVLQRRLPNKIFKRSRDVISAARHSLSQSETIPLDYQGFVRFLASCPVPTVDATDVRKTEFLGAGWTMTVFRGRWEASGKPQVVAVKQLNLDLALGISSQEDFTEDHRLKIASVILEIRMMSHELLRNHQNIVRLLGITWHEAGIPESGKHIITPALIVELAACIDGKPLTLEKHVLAKNESLTLDTKTMLLADIASGLAALHALGVVHGDVKPDNILLFETSSRFIAKISDFGFCLAGDEDLETTKGGTPYWNAPECIPDVSAELGSFRHQNMRDYFSYGLVIWFVLFESLPFQGDLKAFNALKLQPSMKESIDEIFYTRYRMCPLGPESQSTLSMLGQSRQEQYHIPSQRWVPCFDNKQHLLRFIIQWVLVRSPPLRANTFVIYERLFHTESSLRVAQKTFETPGAWDAEWDEFGQPTNRLMALKLPAERFLVHQKSLYAIDVEELKDKGGNCEFSRANQKSAEFIQKLQGKSIPSELQKEILNQSLYIVNQGNKSLEHLRIIAESYMTGFGVDEDREQALYWYRRAAEAGDAEASDVLIRNLSPASAVSQLGRNLYCQLLTQVLLAPFNEGGDGAKVLPSPARRASLNKLEKILCGYPDLTQTPLERAFQILTQQRRYAQDGHLETDAGRRKSWDIAVLAIKEDDQEILIQALRDDPDLIRGRSEGADSLAHIAVRYGRAGLLRMLLQDFNCDPTAADVNGLTPLSLAVKLGATWAVRVLIFAQRQAVIPTDAAAFDNASEGSGDLTRVLYDNFVDKRQDQDQTDQLGPNSFGLWSLYSLVSSVMNNNWGVFCTLLDIGVDPNTVHDSFSTPDGFISSTLLAASMYNSIMLATLLTFGASPHIRVPFPEGKTPLHYACCKYQDGAESITGTEYKYLENFKDWTLSRAKVSPEDFPSMQRLSIWILLENGADLEARDYHGNTPLAYALAKCADLYAFRMLLERNPPANINSANFSGHTLLHEFARDGNLSYIELLLKFGANLEQRTEIGQTALAVAAKGGNLKICERLLVAGASIMARDSNGQNCLSLAVQNSQFEIINLFEASALKKSTNELDRLILDEDCRGWNALRTCIWKSEEDDGFVGLLEKWLDSVEGLFLDARDAIGFTLLHVAVVSSQACAEILLERGASVNIKDSILGWTPLHHAVNEASEEMWSMLLQYDADFDVPDNLMGWTPLAVMEKSMDRLSLDENVDFETPERERLARTRSKLRDRVTAFYGKESQSRIVRPLTQADHDHQLEINRAIAFPDQLDVDAAVRAKSERRLKKCFYVDGEGLCRHVDNVDPSRNVSYRN